VQAYHCITSKRFVLAALIGVLVSILYTKIAYGHIGVSWIFWEHWKDFLFLVVFFPFIEELSFRGVLQDWLGSMGLSSHTIGGLTAANILTSFLFVSIHLVHNPLYKALLVFFPSLVLGYFKDRCRSVLPSVALHMIYNFVFLLLNR
jgi:membrane protease YdiL (CAAX protease family)